jgi:hypothetical protein
MFRNDVRGIKWHLYLIITELIGETRSMDVATVAVDLVIRGRLEALCREKNHVAMDFVVLVIQGVLRMAY